MGTGWALISQRFMGVMKSALNKWGLPVFAIVELHLKAAGFVWRHRHSGRRKATQLKREETGGPRPRLKSSHLPFREPSAGCSLLYVLLHDN